MGGRKRGGAERLQSRGGSGAVQFEGHWSFSLSPYFLLGYFHMGPPGASLSCSYFLVGEQHLVGEARAWSEGVAVQVQMSHNRGTWHLCKVREKHKLCLWGNAAAKGPLAAKGRILHSLGKGQEEMS